MSSIPLLSTNTTVLCRVVKALYDAAPGYTYLQNFLSYANTNGINATVNALASNFASQSNATLAATVCTNLGLTGTAYTAGVAYLTAQFNASTAANRGVVISDAMTALSALSSDATFGSAAQAFNAAVARSETYSTNSSNTSTDLSVLQGADDTTSATTFNLTTSVETASGTSGNDEFFGNSVSGSVTYNAGDTINGGAGTDSLTVTFDTAGGVVNTNGVELFNMRLLSSVSVNAIGFSGLSTINVSGTDDLTLTITNANQATLVKISDDANVNISYLDETGSGDVARLGIDNGGVSGSAATFTISGTEAVTLSASGTSFVAVSAADNALADITISGVGTLDFSVSEASISGLSLAQFSGTSTVRLGAASNVNLTGGTEADTFAFGTTYNGLDTVRGGAGNDTLTAELNGIVSFGSVSEVETGSFTGGSTVVADMNSGSFTTINLLGLSGANTDVTINNMGAVTLNVAGRASGQKSDLAFDYSGAPNSQINFSHSGGAVLYSSLTVTNASGVTMGRTTGASGDLTIASGTVDASGKALTLNASSGSFTLTAMSGIGLTSINATVAGSGTLSNTTFGASGATSISMNVGSRGAGTLGAFALSTGTHTISLTATGDGAAATIGNVIAQKSGTETFTLIAEGSGASVAAGNIGSGAQQTITIRGDGAAAQARAGNVTTDSGTTTISLGVSGAAASGSLGDITLNTAVAMTVTLNASGDSNLFASDFAGVTGSTLGFTVNAPASGDVTVSSMELTSDASAATTLTLDIRMGSGDFTLTSAQAFSIVSISGTAGGATNVGTAQFTLTSANTVGPVNWGGSGSLQLGVVNASGIGAITVSDGAFSGTFNALATLGALTLAGDGIVVNASADRSIGAITIGASNSGAVTINNGTNSATFGNITVAGGGNVSIDVGFASGLGTLVSTKSGQLTFSGANADGRLIASLGAGSNDIYVTLAGSATGSFNGDLYTLTAATGADYFRFATSGNQDVSITNFQLASGTDRIYLATAGIQLGVGSALSSINETVGAVTAAVVTGAGSTTESVLILQSGTFASLADLASGLASGRYMMSAGGTNGGVTAGNEFVVMWADTNGDTHVTLVTTQVSAAANGALFSAITTSNLVDLAFLDDVDIRSVASGASTFTDKFWVY